MMLSSSLPAVAETNAPAVIPGWLSQPMSLTNALTIALLRNSSIVKARSDLEAARGIAIQTRAVALPKLRGSSDYTHTEAVEEFPFTNSLAGAGTRISPPRDQWSGDIRIVQPIYEGGAIRSALRTARLTMEQSALQFQVVVADLLLDVRTAYHDVLLAEQQIFVQEASVKLLSEQLETTNRRFEVGAVPRFDVLRGEVELANARPRLIRAKNAYRVAKNNLATLLAYNLPATVREDIPLTLTGKLEPEPYSIELPAAVAQALARRPELGVFRKTEALRKERITVAKSIYKPIISLFAGYEARNSSNSFRNDFFSSVAGPMAGVELNWDIYDGTLTKGKVIEAEALHEKAQEDLADAGRRIEQEVRTAYSSFLEAREVLESQKKVQERAEEALRLAAARYEAGTSTQLDVLDAQTALTEARTTQVQAARDYIVARARLERAMGEDAWPEPPKPGTK
jgi:TolC family type I secretion outer membrane protein